MHDAHIHILYSGKHHIILHIKCSSAQLKECNGFNNVFVDLSARNSFKLVYGTHFGCKYF